MVYIGRGGVRLGVQAAGPVYAQSSIIIIFLLFYPFHFCCPLLLFFSCLNLRLLPTLCISIGDFQSFFFPLRNLFSVSITSLARSKHCLDVCQEDFPIKSMSYSSGCLRIYLISAV